MESDRGRGRPQVYPDEVYEEIMDRLHEGEFLHRMVGGPGQPLHGSLGYWLKKHDRTAEYREAMMSGIELRLHRAVEMAGDESRDEGKNWTVQRRDELRLKAEQWMAQRLITRYSDKIQTEHAGEVKGSLVIGDSASVAEVARWRRENDDA